jgi:hypothetical protein
MWIPALRVTGCSDGMSGSWMPGASLPASMMAAGLSRLVKLRVMEQPSLTRRVSGLGRLVLRIWTIPSVHSAEAQLLARISSAGSVPNGNTSRASANTMPVGAKAPSRL